MCFESTPVMSKRNNEARRSKRPGAKTRPSRAPRATSGVFPHVPSGAGHRTTSGVVPAVDVRISEAPESLSVFPEAPVSTTAKPRPGAQRSAELLSLVLDDVQSPLLVALARLDALAEDASLGAEASATFDARAAS